MSFLWRRDNLSAHRTLYDPGDLSAQSEGGSGEDEIQELKAGADLAILNPHTQGPTLLPAPVARIVSGVTGLGSFYVRASTKIGGWGLAAGREATLKSLEVSRAVVETVMLAAGKDVIARAQSEFGRLETENMLEKSISTLHTAISTISFATSLGFQSTQTVIDSVSALSIQGLSTLNIVLGSTESSRAVAAIITMIKNELNRPDEKTGEVANYLDLLVGTVAFVLLQRWGRRKTELEFREAGGEELIWDTVIDDKGFRADVVATNKRGMVTATRSVATALANGSGIDDVDLRVDQGLDSTYHNFSLSREDHVNLSDEEIRNRIISQLPLGARATILTETMTFKKVTVTIHEGETANIEPPPGLTMISESLTHNEQDRDTREPQQTIVFRTSLARSSSADISPSNRLDITNTHDEVVEGVDDEDVVMMNTTSGRISVTDHGPNDQRRLPGSPTANPASLANVKKSRKPMVHSVPDAMHKPGLFSPSSGKRAAKDTTRNDTGGGVIKKALRSLSHYNLAADSRQSGSTAQSRRQTAAIEPLSPIDARNGQDLISGRRFYPAGNGGAGALSYRPTSPVQTPQSRRESSASYFAMHERKRESTISQTDSYSTYSTESRPSSPNLLKTHSRSLSGISKTKSQTEITIQSHRRSDSQDRVRHHRRSGSHAPSLYSMATKNSDEAIILAPRTSAHKSVFEDHEILVALANDGLVPGMFPKDHLVKVVRRFARFATASYGNNFLRMMGLWATPDVSTTSTELVASHIHHEHNSFSTHTGLPADCILLSSFFDANGAAGAANVSSGVISPLAHFVSADHDQKAIVLTCRGTLGFEDVLTDMAFDYDDLYWQGQSYHVHKGIHAAARRLLSPLGNRVMQCIKQHLEVYPDYGLILCGHSLGGAVAAILAIMLSEPTKSDATNTAFVTASVPKLLAHTASTSSSAMVTLPPGRPIHAYAFGPPATVSPALRLATRGLVITIINSNDIVPSLSLGNLHDTRNVALHLKKDANGQLLQLRSRVLSRIRESFYTALRTDAKEKGPPPPEKIAGDGMGEDTWAWTELESIRKHMNSEKLLPPGECFVIETSRVFDRVNPDEGVSAADETAEARYFRALGRPATRVQFKLIRDVEKRLAEIRFGSHMFGDHSPGRYEAALAALEKGVCED